MSLVEVMNKSVTTGSDFCYGPIYILFEKKHVFRTLLNPMSPERNHSSPLLVKLVFLGLSNVAVVRSTIQFQSVFV